MIISRKQYEREMGMRKAEIDLLNHQMAKLVGEVCRLQDDVIGMQIRLEQFNQEDGPAEAEQEDTVLTIHCKECRHAIETLDGRLVCEHDKQEHDPDFCCNKVD